MASFFTKVPGIAIAAAIAIVFAGIVIYASVVLFPYPEYPFFEAPQNMADCIAESGSWDEEYGYCIGADPYSGPEIDAYYAAYNEVLFNQFVFIILVSLAAVILGLFFIKNVSVASGLLFGGLIGLIWGSLYSLSVGPLGLVAMVLVLAILIVAAYRKKGK